MTWQIDEAALQRLKDLDGVFVLKTNRRNRRHSIAAVLRGTTAGRARWRSVSII